MPRMTGAQLMEAIHARWPQMPVILATGYAQLPGGIGVEVTKLGKPFSEQDLARAIATVRHR